MAATALGVPASWCSAAASPASAPRRSSKKSDVDVVLVDKHDYHTFQPLLYQVATGLLEQPAVGHPIRDLFHEQANARVHQDTVTAIDLDAREVRFGELEPLELRLPRPRARRRGQLLRRRRRAGARVPAVHAAPTQSA